MCFIIFFFSFCEHKKKKKEKEMTTSLVVYKDNKTMLPNVQKPYYTGTLSFSGNELEFIIGYEGDIYFYSTQEANFKKATGCIDFSYVYIRSYKNRFYVLGEDDVLVVIEMMYDEQKDDIYTKKDFSYSPRSDGLEEEKNKKVKRPDYNIKDLYYTRTTRSLYLLLEDEKDNKQYLRQYPDAEPGKFYEQEIIRRQKTEEEEEYPDKLNYFVVLGKYVFIGDDVYLHTLI